MNSLGEAIRRLRKTRSLTQGQLGVKSGVPRPTITGIEQGYRENPTIDTLLKLSLALNTTVDPILRLAGYLPPVPETVPGEQEAVALFRSLSAIRCECALIMLRALSKASQSSVAIMVPKTKNELLELINESWYNLTVEQQTRIRDLVLDAVQQQISEDQGEAGGGEQERQECRA